jgi:hypothetical protein
MGATIPDPRKPQSEGISYLRAVPRSKCSRFTVDSSSPEGVEGVAGVADCVNYGTLA